MRRLFLKEIIEINQTELENYATPRREKGSAREESNKDSNNPNPQFHFLSYFYLLFFDNLVRKIAGP